MAKFTPKKKKQLRRIRRFISSAEKRGYTFPEDIKRNLTSYTTHKLKSLTPSKLYKQASYQVKDLAGNLIDILTGEQGRRIETTLAAKKAVRTKQYKKWQKEVEAGISLSDYQYEDYDYEQDYAPKFTDIVLSQIEEMIQEAYTNVVYVGSKWTTRDNADILSATLQSQISMFGRDAVAQVCENAPDEMKANARLTLQASSDYACHTHIDDIVQIITGEILTQEQSKTYTMDV